MLAHLTTAVAPTSADLPLVAFVVMIAGVAVLLAVVLVADRAGLLPISPVPFGKWTAATAAGLSWGAAAIHFAVIAAHFAEYAPFGVAFAALAWFQVGWAFAWVVGRRSPLALIAIAVNGGALAVWAISRTVGLPVGPAPGELEPVGSLDVLAAILEVGLIGLLAWDLRARSSRLRPALSPATATVVVGSVVLAVVVATSVAFASTGEADHDHDGSGDAPAPSGSAAPEIGPIATDGLAVELPSGPSASPEATTRPESAEPSAAAPTPAGEAAPSQSLATSPATSRRPVSSPTPAAPAATPRPATPGPTVRPDAHPGVIAFGSALDSSGRIAAPDHQFREGDTAVWIADFRRAPAVPGITRLIVQVLADGREFEHWREQVTISDPAATRLVGTADLSLYAHGGVGSYRLRYLIGDELLAEGTFELVP